MHYYQFNISDYQSHTKHLTPIEDICYRRLLDWQYMHEKPISTDLVSVCRLLMLRDYSADVEQVLNEFFVLTDDGWINNRAFDEIEQYQDKSKKASEAGKASAAKRSLNSRSTNNQQDTEIIEQSFNGRSTDVQLTINQEPLTINHKPVLKEKNNKKEKADPIREELSEVTDQTFADFIQLRKAKKAPLTIRAIQSIKTEASKAGISLETALIECCSRGWQSFKSDWFHNSQAPPAHQSKQQLASVAARSIFGTDSRNEKLIEGEIVRYECITG